MKQSVKQKVTVMVNCCVAFLERIIDTACHLLGGDLDLATGRDDINLGDMAV